MAYCTKCGAQLPEGANFCANCGTAVAPVYTSAVSSVPVTTYTETVQTAEPVYSGNGYAVMLVDCGACSQTAAADLISDTCGYTDAEALTLVANAPTLIAQSLTEQQAVYLAQSLTEYGIEAAIYDSYGNRTLYSELDSVYDSNGSFLTGVAAALGLIGVTNRISGAIRRLTLNQRPAVYTPRKPAPKPPVRRHALRQPAPAPKPAPARPRKLTRVRPAQPKPAPMHSGAPAAPHAAAKPAPVKPRQQSAPKQPAQKQPASPRGGKPQGGPGGKR